MAREFAKPFYDSKEWQKCREAYIKYRKAVDGGVCESCGEELGYIVHHKVELSPENINDPDITLNFNNLKYDCLKCHNVTHNGAKDCATGLVRYRFDDQGELIPLV